jgi:hypothetical protein
MLWPNMVPKRPIYAHRSQREVAERFTAEIFGSRAVSRVALVEPVSTRIQMDGSIVEKTTGKIYDELKRMSQWLLNHRIMSDPVPPDADLSRYQIAFLPSGLCLSTREREDILTFVRSGGTLVATLAPGLYDAYTKPDGTLIKVIGVEATLKKLGDHVIKLGEKDYSLPPAAVYSYQPTKAFKGRVLGRYASGEPCWIETALGLGKVVLIGFAATLSPEVVNKHVIPIAFGSARSREWKVDAGPIVEVFEKEKDGNRLIFVLNRDHRNCQPADITFSKAQDVVDLRGSLYRKLVGKLVMNRLWPGECRIFKVIK